VFNRIVKNKRKQKQVVYQNTPKIIKAIKQKGGDGLGHV
jgi:hypothetical protein